MPPLPRAYTWCFDVTIQIGALATQEEACACFKDILNAAEETREISGLKQSSFSYDVPDNCLVKISGYLHVKKECPLYESTVREWIIDDRIRGEIEWTRILPGRNKSWKQHPLIQNIFSACDGGSRRLEDWVGNSTDTIDRGGRPWPKQADRGQLGQAGMGGSEADLGGGSPRPRGRPPRPPPVDTDTPVMAAVRSKLRSMCVETLLDICTFVFPDQKSRNRQPKEIARGQINDEPRQARAACRRARYRNIQPGPPRCRRTVGSMHCA